MGDSYDYNPLPGDAPASVRLADHTAESAADHEASALVQAIWSPPTDVRVKDARVSDAASQLRDMGVRGRLAPSDSRLSLVEDGVVNSGTQRTRTGTITSSVFNLTNTILGSGTLAMPYACKLCGVGVFVGLMVFTAIAAHFAVFALFTAVERLNIKRPRYPTLGRAALGVFGEQVASWAVTLQQIGACVGYIVIIGDVLHPISALSGWPVFCDARWPLQLMLVAFVIFPLCLMPTMDSLKYVSMASIGLILAAVVAVIVNGFLVIADPGRRSELLQQSNSSVQCGMPGVVTGRNSSAALSELASSAAGPAATGMRMVPNTFGDVLSALALISFAFLCHQNTFPIYKDLKNPSTKRMTIVSRNSLAICCTVYICTGIMGYYTFLDDTKSDLLKNFHVTGTYFSVPMDVVRSGFGVSMVLSFPLMVWEARHNLDVLIFGIRPYEFWRNFGLNLAIVTITAGIGMSVSTLDQVLGVVGSTCSPLMVYILPAVFLLKSFDRHACCCNCRSKGGVALLTYGLLLIPTCLFIWVLTYFVCAGGNSNVPALCESFGL